MQVAPEAGSRRFTVALPLSLQLLAHETYVVEVQPINETLLRLVGAALGRRAVGAGVIELPVERAWRPAVVAVIVAEDDLPLPKGLRVARATPG